MDCDWPCVARGTVMRAKDPFTLTFTPLHVHAGLLTVSLRECNRFLPFFHVGVIMPVSTPDLDSFSPLVFNLPLIVKVS